MKVSRYGAEIMQRLEGEGVRLTPMDVLRINDIGLAIESPAGEQPGTDSPVVVWAGDVPFYALTLQAAEWQESFALRWWEGEMQTKAIAYAHARARVPDAFKGDMEQRRLASAIIAAWWKCLPVTPAEVYAAVEAVQTHSMSDTVPADDSDAPDVVRQLVSDLVASTSVPASEWRMESLSFALNTFRTWARSQAAINGISPDELRKSTTARANMQMFKLLDEIRGRQRG
jgi:hypothetical protein